MAAAIIYSFCAITALMCAGLLLSSFRTTGYALLLWSGLCFAGLTLSNILLVLDKVVITDTDLGPLRTGTAFVSMMVLLYGLIWDSK